MKVRTGYTDSTGCVKFNVAVFVRTQIYACTWVVPCEVGNIIYRLGLIPDRVELKISPIKSDSISPALPDGVNSI
jgi:hypothetical protein